MHSRCLHSQAIPFLPSFLDTYSLTMSSRPCVLSSAFFFFFYLWSIYLTFSLVHFKNDLEYLTRGTGQEFIPLVRFRLAEIGFEKLSHSYKELFSYFFFHHYWFDGINFQYSQVLVIFLSSKCFDFFLIWLFYLFPCLSFFASHQHCTFFYAIFHSFILAVYSYCLYQSPILCHSTNSLIPSVIW